MAAVVFWGALFVVSFRLEPRRLLNAVLLLLAVDTAAVTAFGYVGELVTAHDDPDTNRLGGLLLLGTLLMVVLLVLLLCVFLVANGVVLVRKEGRRLANLLSLGLGLAGLAYGVLVVATVVGRTPSLGAPLVLGLLPLGYLGFLFTAYLLYSFAYGWWVRRHPPPVDGVVVLGAGLVRGKVGPLLRSRLDAGRDAYERSLAAGRRTRLVTSGGQGPDEPCSESWAMAEYLRERGVPDDALVLEQRSTTTAENLAFSRVILQDNGITGSVAVVTSNYHALRAALLMRAEGIPGYSLGSPTARYFWPSAMIREFAAVLRDHLVVNAIVVAVLTAPVVWATAVALVSTVS